MPLGETTNDYDLSKYARKKNDNASRSCPISGRRHVIG